MCEIETHDERCKCDAYLKYREQFPERIHWFCLRFKYSIGSSAYYMAYNVPEINTNPLNSLSHFIVEHEGQLYFITSPGNISNYGYFKIDPQVIEENNLMLCRRLTKEEQKEIYDGLSNVQSS